VTTLLVLGDTLDPKDTMELSAAEDAKVEVVFVGPFVSGAARSAAVALPSASWSEADGTYVNFEGRAQRVRRCHLPLHDARPGWRIAADVAEAAGVAGVAFTSADEAFASLANRVKAFEGLSVSALGLLGVPAPAAAGA